MISGDKGFSEEMSSLVKSCTDNPSSPFTYTILFSSFVLVGSVVFLSLSLSLSLSAKILLLILLCALSSTLNVVL